MKKSYLILPICMLCANARALEYSTGDWNFKLDADGMVGFLEPRKEKPLFIGDWDVKVSALYKLNTTQRIGAVYSIDAACVEDDEYVHDAFVLFQDKTVGRVELGLTHSIARKMGLGLPDVGYLRINNKSILHKKLDLNRVLISDTTATTGHDALRLNLATISTDYGQYGISFAGLGGNFNFAIDTAAKFKHSLGKTKTAYSIALSYMNKPKGYEESSFNPPVTADWRAQAAIGANIQYNSVVWGTSARLIYDENPIEKTADGLVVGTGFSYDLLQSSISLNYIYSNTNVFEHHDKISGEKMVGDYLHTIIASFRYKYTEHTALFMSGGITDTTPFFAVGIKSGF